MIVIDTNILISALIRDSLTRRIIVESGLSLAYPEASMKEVIKYRAYILEKGGYSREAFDSIVNKLLEYVNLVPDGVIQPHLDQAAEMMKNIDLNDSIFLAAAFALNSPIWSDDSHFQGQKAIKIITTGEMARIFEK